MGVNKFNCEGYYDPTAYEALTKIEQEAKALRAFRPVVYICSPLAGDMVKNQENARTYCRFAVEAGCVPIAPHIYFTQFMNDNDRRSVTWHCSWTSSYSPNAPSCGCSERKSPAA